MTKFRFKEAVSVRYEDGAELFGGMIQRGWLKFLEWDGVGDMQLHFFENPEYKD